MLENRWPYQSLAEPPPAALPPAESVTLDKWYRPASEPVRRKVVNEAGVFVLPQTVTAADSPESLDWYQPLSLPIRRKIQIHEGFYVRGLFDENVNLAGSIDSTFTASAYLLPLSAMLDYDGDDDGVFTHLGVLLAEYNFQRDTGQDWDLAGQWILDAFDLGDRDLEVQALPARVQNFKGEYVARRSFLADLMLIRMQQRESVLEEIGAVSSDQLEILTKLHHRMIIDGETIDRSTVTIGSVDAAVENTGNGTVLTTKLLDGVSSPGRGPHGDYPSLPDYRGVDSELAVTEETMLLICVLDSDTDGAAEGSEQFAWTGGPAHSGHGIETNQGSGTIGTVTVANSETLLSNLDFEDFTSNVPDDWDLDSGTAGTHVLETTTSGEYYHGDGGLEFAGDGAQATIQISQTLSGIGSTVQAGRLYFVSARIKASATIAAGDLTIQFEGTGYTASSTEKISIAPGSLPTDWTLYSFWIVMPDELPDDMELVVKWTGTPTNAKSVWVDDLAFAAGNYGGGIACVVVRGSEPFVRDDRFSFDVTNDDAGTFQRGFREVFGVQMPSSTSPTIADSLAE